MPSVLREGAYRFFFYASDRYEPPHIHVQRDNNVAKFWLDPPRLQSSGGFAPIEINKIARIVTDHRAQLLEAWNEYFGRRN